IAAIDAFGHVDVVAGGAPAAILAWLGLDRDRQSRADRLAQLAGDTALLAIGIPPERMLAAKPRAERALFIGVIDRDRALKHVARTQRMQNITNTVFSKNQIGAESQVNGGMLNGGSQPPRNRIVVMPLTRIMLPYSPRKNRAKAIAEYSTK